MSENETLLSPLTSLGHSTVIAAGPWLFTVLALSAIKTLSSSLMTPQTLSNFRAVIIYAFLLSLIATAPIVMLSVRLLSDAIYLRHLHRVRPLFIATLILGGVASAALAVLIEGVLFNLKGGLLLASVQSCTLIGLIWVSLAFCSAVRDFNTITASFISGLSLCVLATVASAAADSTMIRLVDSFNIGLGIILFGLTRSVLLTFPQPMSDIRDPLRELWVGLHTYSMLVLGALVGIVAAWVDKWIMWLGPSGEAAIGGLLNAPIYDSAMFVAYLSIIPALGLFVSTLETAFFDRYTHYFSAIHHHATLESILENARELSKKTLYMIMRIMFMQVAFCTIIVLCAPLIAPAFGLQNAQVAILRFGAIGALAQFLFLVCSSLLLYFQRYSEYTRLQVAFLALSAIGTTATVFLGQQTYGFGYLAASVLSGLAALFVLEKTMEDLPYLTFVDSNAKTSPAAAWGGIRGQIPPVFSLLARKRRML